jgi:hypothetical protein
MPKAVRISAPVSASTSSSQKSNSNPLATVALFSGIGLLASLVAILMGVPVAWY